MSSPTAVGNRSSSALEQVNSKGEQAPATVARLRAVFDSSRTRPLEFRQEQLAGIARFLNERESEIESAIHQDLGRPSIEIYASEIALIAGEVALTRKKLRSWTKPRRVPTSLVGQPGKSQVYHEPLGVVLIIGPWNYPLQLVLAPLVGAIAAGNCAIVKPSEVVPTISSLLAARLPEYVDPECVSVIEGGVDITTELLSERFDHIFYTGNGTVGRIVMEAAARHLTPVTLELGGKSPCLVDQQTDLDVAARRIVWGKFYNAGQTCVAPDYVLVHEAAQDGLLSRLKETIHSFFGDDPRKSPDYGRIVNGRHHRRLMKLIPGSGEIVTGGTADEDARYIAPTILRNVPTDAPVMADEIFGPILPVLPVKDMEQAIAFVNERPKALALYLFSSDPLIQESVLERTSSGGVTINHALLHLTVPALPFGGVGASGMGAYHGRATFETFSHKKSVLVKPTWFDPSFFYPPYTNFKKKLIHKLL
jgi:aldehyde dehydrogenase (NAD+)